MNYFRTWAEIDLDNIRYNFKNIKKRAGEGIMTAAVIKADGYGHGSVEIAHEIKDIADCFSVAMIEEALVLRNSGIENPIHVLGYIPDEALEAAILNEITASIWTLEQAQALSDKAAELGKCAELFVAVDTGMSRIGFDLSEKSAAEISEISLLPYLGLVGLFSHMAKADERDKSSANLQCERFSKFIEKLEAIGLELPVCSLYNSAGIIDMEKRFNLVRAGIILYGLEPSNEVMLENIPTRPVMSLKTRVIHLHTVEKGEGVSYGHTYVSPEKRLIATLSAGYADGVPRLLSNKGRVIINGEYAPITGRICMDLFMVDVTDIPDIKVNDIATIIGSEGDKTITAGEVAKHAQTINYEITCSISKRVPRIFIKNKKRFKVTLNLESSEKYIL